MVLTGANRSVYAYTEDEKKWLHLFVACLPGCHLSPLSWLRQQLYCLSILHLKLNLMLTARSFWQGAPFLCQLAKEFRRLKSFLAHLLSDAGAGNNGAVWDCRAGDRLLFTSFWTLLFWPICSVNRQRQLYLKVSETPLSFIFTVYQRYLRV